MKNPEYIVNAVRRRLEMMFDGYFPTNTKHKFYRDYGYPEILTFEHYYNMFERNGIAKALVTKVTDKTWQDNPWLLESEKVHKETSLEKAVRLRFEELGVWERLAEADEKAEVGEYGAVILRFADGKRLREPVESLRGGLNALVELIPVYQGQLEPSTWQLDELSDDYGMPTMYMFNEAAVGEVKEGQSRQVEVHPDRVLIWSANGKPFGKSALKACFNDLITLEKVMGAGGEGFWRNAKNAPLLNMDPEAQPATLAKMLGTTEDKLGDKVDELLDDYNKGFDKFLMFRGIDAKQLPVTLTNPKEFILGPLQACAASRDIPLKILLGTQTGERASTEDTRDWTQSIMTRRSKRVKPNVRRLVRRLVEFGVLPAKDWVVDWSDLTEMTTSEKIEVAGKMAEVNSKMAGIGEIVFTENEIRERIDLEPKASDATPPDDDEDDDDEVENDDA